MNDEQELRRLLALLSSEELPVNIVEDQYKMTGLPSVGMMSNLPIEMQLNNPNFARFYKYQDSPIGKVGLSYGNEPISSGPRISYEKLNEILGGLLNVKGELGNAYRKGELKFSPSDNLEFSAGISKDQLGNVMKNLQAQYIKKLNEDLMLGIVGRAGTNPYVGMQLMGRF